MKLYMSLLAAFQFLTILPVKRSFTTEQIARSTMFFPLVGLAIGLVLALINWLLGFLMPDSVINILLVALLAFCSGGLHLDGLADTMDGAAGHRSVERRLEIMRDSRIGGFGAIGLILMLLMEYVFLNAIPGNLKWLSLIAAPTISRWAMVYAIYAFPYARPGWLGQGFQGGSHSKTVRAGLSHCGCGDYWSVGSGWRGYFGWSVYNRDPGRTILEKSVERVNRGQLRSHQ